MVINIQQPLHLYHPPSHQVLMQSRHTSSCGWAQKILGSWHGRNLSLPLSCTERRSEAAVSSKAEAAGGGSREQLLLPCSYPQQPSPIPSCPPASPSPRWVPVPGPQAPPGAAGYLLIQQERSELPRAGLSQNTNPASGTCSAWAASEEHTEPASLPETKLIFKKWKYTMLTFCWVFSGNLGG